MWECSNAVAQKLTFFDDSDGGKAAQKYSMLCVYLEDVIIGCPANQSSGSFTIRLGSRFPLTPRVLVMVLKQNQCSASMVCFDLEDDIIVGATN